MSIQSPDQSRHRLVRILEPVIYGDIFDYPLTLDEIHKFYGAPITLDALESEIRENRDFKRLISSSDGFFYLSGRDDIVALRNQRNAESRIAWRTARRVVGFIKYVPFVKGILATGSLAVDNVRKKDDLDFLVLIAPHRLWFAFFILGILQKVFLRRFLCPNYYISINHLRLPRKNFYTAREAVQARPMFGGEACSRFRDENAWVFDIFPNARMDRRAQDAQNKSVERKGLLGFLTGSIEWLFSGKRGDLVEAILKKMLKHRLTAHYGKHGQSAPESVLKNALDEVELRFHGLKHEEMIYREIMAKKKRIHTILDNGSPGAGNTQDPV